MTRRTTVMITVGKKAEEHFVNVIKEKQDVGAVKAMTALLSAIAHSIHQQVHGDIYKIFQGNGSLVITGLTKPDIKKAKHHVKGMREVLKLKLKTLKKSKYKKILRNEMTVGDRIAMIDPEDISDVAEWVYDRCFSLLDEKEKEK